MLVYMYFPVSLYVFPLGIVYIHSGVIQKVLLYRSNIDVMKQNLNMLKMSEIKSLLKFYAFHIVYGNYNAVIWSTVSFNLRTMVPCYMWLVIKLINVSNAIPTLCGFIQISVYWCSYIWLIVFEYLLQHEHLTIIGNVLTHLIYKGIEKSYDVILFHFYFYYLLNCWFLRNMYFASTLVHV